MAIFSPQTLEQIRAASDIVEIISGYLPLKRAGANFVALCPFHQEKTPSSNVNPHRHIFHRFGCHKGGDVFTFVKEYENISFPDAVRGSHVELPELHRRYFDPIAAIPTSSRDSTITTLPGTSCRSWSCSGALAFISGPSSWRK